MAQQHSGDEVKAKYVALMGEDLGKVFFALYAELSWVHVKWKQYFELFDSKENVKILRHAAGFFFGVIQDVLWREVVLHIARLMDSPKSMGQDNLSLQRLPDAVLDPTLKADVEALVAIAKGKAQFARNWRNKNLAHRDLAHALDPKSNPVNPGTRQEVEDVLKAMRDVMNKVEDHCSPGSHVAFEHTVPPPGDARYLVERLSRIVGAEDEWLRRRDKGRPPDHHHP